MFATVATMPERRVTEPSGPAPRSAMYAVAVANAAPSAMPVSTRATSRPASDFQAMKTSLSLSISPNLHVVKERLGHESITTTIDTYGHLLPSTDAALMDGLAALFEGASAPPDNVMQLQR
jgi:integrase